MLFEITNIGFENDSVLEIVTSRQRHRAKGNFFSVRDLEAEAIDFL